MTFSPPPHGVSQSVLGVPVSDATRDFMKMPLVCFIPWLSRLLLVQRQSENSPDAVCPPGISHTLPSAETHSRLLRSSENPVSIAFFQLSL